MNKYFFIMILFLGLSTMLPGYVYAQEFAHPGIDQTSADLVYMKKQVLSGENPWKPAFDRLKASVDLDFTVKPYAHVQRGPYGKPNIGGDDLSKGANLAYNCALLWYITANKAYAKKAIEILNVWSPVLWDFDYNDAKLLAGWTGHVLCNAAEILRYTNSGWKQADIENFSNMLMTVYYPLLRYYYPLANGNWDGAIIHSIMAIGIFTDNHEMFNNAVSHFLYGYGNGSIFKYIYPSGQCQESTRDQGHVQLGLGEFAGAARVAYTQGVDLFSIADNRIALGFEYTAKFLSGQNPHCYGIISERARKFSDNYEYVYRHYTSKGVEMPFTKTAADSVRSMASRSVLIAFRAPSGKGIQNSGTPKPGTVAYPTGAMAAATLKAPSDAVIVNPGESIQKALDAAAGTGRWVIAKAGLHTLPNTLKIPSGVTLAGEGIQTVLFLDPASGARDAIVNADNDLHDVSIRDLVVEGALKPDPGTDPNSGRSFRSLSNRGGIVFLTNREAQMKNINFTNITVQNCTYNGVFINGAEGVSIIGCNFNENGSNVIPGPKLEHNLLLTHCTKVKVDNCRMDTSPFGSGIALDHCSQVKIDSCEIARNAYYGILIDECNQVALSGNFIEANDKSGVMVEFLSRGSNNVDISNNLIHFNNGYGIEAYDCRLIKSTNNTMVRNGNRTEQQKITADKYIVME